MGCLFQVQWGSHPIRGHPGLKEGFGHCLLLPVLQHQQGEGGVGGGEYKPLGSSVALWVRPTV